jgi:hypothetical protein
VNLKDEERGSGDCFLILNGLWAGNNYLIEMHFSSVPTLIDAHMQCLLEGTVLKNASLFLYVAKKNPLVL